MAKPDAAWNALRAFALSLPEAHEEFPWGYPVVKVRKKIFVFLGSRESKDARIALKLPESLDVALSVPGALPTGHGLGKAGWVTLPFGPRMPSVEILIEWVIESYRAIAPKTLIARLDAADRSSER